MKDFIYDIPTKIYFGKDQFCHLGEVLAQYGKKVLLVYGGGSIKKIGLYDTIQQEIQKAGLTCFEVSGVLPNPRIDKVREGVQVCKEQGIDMVLAAGGGSALDTGKMIAIGACVDCDPWDFFIKRVPAEKALPIITIPTLAATGSEMDNVAVLSNPDTDDKRGAKTMLIQPKVSFLDPETTYTVKAYHTACGAADILSHTIETYFNPTEGMYLLDTFMEGLMKTVIRYAPIALKEPNNYEARANLMWAASWAINGLFKTCQNQIWSCHAMEHQLSAYYDITHGLGLAILTPRWLEYCLTEQNVDRYVRFGVNVFGLDPQQEPLTIAHEAINHLEHFLFTTLGLKSTLHEVGIGEEHIPVMAQKACSSKGNVIKGFRPLLPEDVVQIYKRCL